ncbi:MULTISPECIES: hypothetical protein [Enterococcus]|uniref:Uncharacterized protein n=1 Tax=Candidatus Enterococcus murrayae TaxID=2815321 RepID=A0ABS3HCP9_9ENTE|nr:hypothetical protein [Enterococcus sp. MJM16]MBO0450812.1 hypothetical protein [Enterococcus sp. MJM16]
MKVLKYLLHLLQLGLIYLVYLMDDLYKNHLGFMRNVSFYSHKVDSSAFGSKLFLLPLVLVLIALLLAIRKRGLESSILLILGAIFLIWQTIFRLETTPIYYLVSSILCLGFLLQLLIVSLKRS